MNNKPPFLLRLLSAALVLSLFSTSCATSPYQKAETAADSVTDAANEIDLSRKQIVDATTALNVLLDRNPTDIRESFRRYDEAVIALDRTFASVNRKADAMAARGESYFEAWDQRLAQMQSEDIRARSAERQREVAERFVQIQEDYRDTREQIPPLMAQLQDIRRLLGADLTPAGLDSVRDFASRANEDAARLRQTLDRLSERFRQLSSTLTPRAL